MMKTKILIVDDLKENILALSQLIESDDVEIFTAETPDEALGLIIDHDFGLAMLDVQMPTMTGFELARLIRGIDKGRHMPIIFVTAQTAESRLIFEGYDSGAVDVLFKPVNPHIVRSKVRVFVKLDQQSRQLAKQVKMMAKLKEDAESANVAKSQFLANMSHEIRTPLSAVLGFSDILSSSDLSEDERVECLASISRNGKLLLRIIDDILDLSRIEAQKMDFEQMPFDLAELLKDLQATLTHKAVEKGIELEIASIPEIALRYVSDPLRLKQVLINMIGNAIKFTNHGKVRVSVESRCIASKASTRQAMHELRFAVSDSGIGMSPEEAKYVFQPFAQADTSTRRRFGGTGLGLAISRQLARSLGGDVVLKQSIQGRGSEFEVTIRAEVTESTVAQQVEDTILKKKMEALRSEDLAGKKILVVDDVSDNRVLIERYLRPAGIEIGTASGGQEAIDMAKVTEWDAVLMDIQMPMMDGYEATAQLRQLGFDKPIIAVTAHAMKEELDRCMEAGCDMTLTKPVAKRDLIQRLSEALA